MILYGTEVALNMRENLLHESIDLKKSGLNPTLGIIRVGNNKSDLSYEKGILKKFSEFEIETKIFELPENISQIDFDTEFLKINLDEKINGILLFRPLPKNLSDKNVREKIFYFKDVDCMGYVNTAKLFSNEEGGFAPCTASAVIEILDFYKIELSGKNVVIVGRSMVLGKPLSMLMLNRNATVTICHSKTENLNEISRNADILVSAIGKAEFIKSDFVNEKSIVIDVGINVNSEGKLCGDVDFKNVSEIVNSITPVPKGVGAVTTSVLAKNVLRSCALNADIMSKILK